MGPASSTIDTNSEVTELPVIPQGNNEVLDSAFDINSNNITAHGNGTNNEAIESAFDTDSSTAGLPMVCTRTKN